MDTLIWLTICLTVGVCYGLNTWDLPSTDLLSLVDPGMERDWMTFKKSYNRSYESVDEEIKRRLYWEDTVQFIEDHNRKYELGEVSYMVGENHFADIAEDEFEKIYMNGVILPNEPEEYPESLTEPDPDVPLSKDWRKEGLVSSVKNQGSCGSCWAFSALGALEGQHKKYYAKLLDLSEQNLVDCANSKWGNFGCRGGWMNNAFNYIKTIVGIDTERCYPYEARDNRCRYNSACSAASDKGSQNVGKGEHSLQQSLANVGPIAIAMDVNHRGFWYYKQGIFYEPRCNKRYPTHAMLAVGYGHSGGRSVWVIKNRYVFVTIKAMILVSQVYENHVAYLTDRGYDCTAGIIIGDSSGFIVLWNIDQYYLVPPKKLFIAGAIK